MNKSGKWNIEDTKFLTDNYHLMTKEQLSEILERSNKSIKDKAWCLKLTNNTDAIWNNDWTIEEDDIIKNNYHLGFDELHLLIPDRKRMNISVRCRDLGLYQDELLTEEQLSSLLKMYENSPKEEILDTFNHLTWNQIVGVCGRFKLHHTEPIPDNVTCECCGLQFEFTSEYFKVSKDRPSGLRRTCIICTEKKAMYHQYKRKYGILLNIDLMYTTFTPIQWWEFVYYGTPNGKKMKYLPKEIYNNNDKLRQIIIHVINNIVGANTRDKILSLNRKSLAKYNIIYDSNIFTNNIFNITEVCFPEYNIQPFEFTINKDGYNMVPKHYWENQVNADNYIKYYIENIIGIENINNPKHDIPLYFTQNILTTLGFSSIIQCLRDSKQYDSYCAWLNSIYPEWKLENSDFKKHIALDGTKLDSYEELMFYNYTNSLEYISIIKCNRMIHKFRNLKHEENYIPDFLIDKINDIELDKPLYIEYYGMYTYKLYKNNKTGDDYRDKTHRKEEYYKNNPDIYYIGLFPSDLKNNFQGVREKLTSFLLENNIHIPSPLKEVV